MTGRKTRVECETPRDFRDMRLTAQDSPRVAGCSVFGAHFFVTDELAFLRFKLAYGAKEIGDEI